ncbi:hypothetical protein H7I41_06485 [Mycobacterium manitobense]|uniref:LppX_LprAFG lipoprotein n=1 Tax=[Mycobacterium] manitobense TaxID=190147 RepID=A0A9X2YLT9_9MYCO|nr:hypothetical protein [[Mycobacterium] manitobense]MCV7169566.1 hypothetical protein [[Mycobacterium] manitobense]
MKATRIGIAVTTAVLAISALSGCSKATEIRDVAAQAAEQVVTSGTEKITQAAAGGDLFTAEGIDAAYAAVSEKVGADPMQVVEVTIISGVLTVQAIDPNAPTELNQWSYTAGVVGPSRPVDYGDDVEALGENLFSVNEVETGAIAAAVDGAVTMSAIPGGEVQSVIIKRNIPFDPSVTMFINVEGERSSKQVRADVSGTITDVV